MKTMVGLLVSTLILAAQPSVVQPTYQPKMPFSDLKGQGLSMIGVHSFNSQPRPITLAVNLLTDQTEQATLTKTVGPGESLVFVFPGSVNQKKDPSQSITTQMQLKISWGKDYPDWECLVEEGRLIPTSSRVNFPKDWLVVFSTEVWSLINPGSAEVKRDWLIIRFQTNDDKAKSLKDKVIAELVTIDNRGDDLLYITAVENTYRFVCTTELFSGAKMVPYVRINNVPMTIFKARMKDNEPNKAPVNPDQKKT